jgi:nitrogen fixation/metabolism regulation signal transduction histidine kinase
MVDRQNGNLRSLKQEIKNLRLLGSEKNKIELERKIEKLEKLMEKKEMNNQLENLQKNIQTNIHHQLNEFFNPYNHCT